MVLGASALLAVPSLAVAQEPPPADPPSDPPSEEVDEAPEAPPPPAPGATSPSPPSEEVDEPPAASPPSAPRSAPLPRGGEAPPPEPEAPRPNRRGATFEMSLGLGFTHVALDGGPSETFGGLSGLNLGLGGWISPRSALTLRIAGTSFFEDIQGTEVQFIAGLIGLSLQHMVSNQAWIGVGLGIGVLTTDQDNIEPETGLGLDLRAGINLYQSAENAIHLAVEVTPGFFDGVDVTGIGIQLGWQSL